MLEATTAEIAKESVRARNNGIFVMLPFEVAGSCING